MPAEREQLTRQLYRALPGGFDFFQVRAPRVARGHVVREHAAVAQDDGEKIVEVVRDPARELADRVHLLRLAELLLRSSERDDGGDVPEVADDRSDGGIGEKISARDFEPSRGPVLVQGAELEIEALGRVFEDPRQSVRNRLAIVGMAEIERGTPQEGGRGATEGGLSGRAHVDDHPACVRQRDHLRALLDEGTEERFVVSAELLAPAERGPCVATRLRLANLSFDACGQAGELVFEDEVVGARAHRFDRRLFSDAPRDDDERDVELLLPQNLERGRGAEARHRPVAQNDVPGAPRPGRRASPPGLPPA